MGSAEEKFDNCADASSGMLCSGCPLPLLWSFKRFRRRCGNSTELNSVALVADAVAGELAGLAEESLGD